ncbi:MAG: YggS family pyridoxal phosphate-dependent enzyme [Gammaproteobacteria bacterium]|nr:YggS family pyridoxal phosphate-dependent enzyme [Gammaproteobacteria bacterium]
MPTNTIIKDNIEQARKRIAAAETKFNRTANSVSLLAVSKTQPTSAILTALEQQQFHFGENYLQEAFDKIDTLQDQPIIWHYIGAIQSNKTRPIAVHFDWVHSVSSLKVATRLSSQRPETLPDLNICLQFNVSNESSKSGASLEELAILATEIAALPRIKLRGLMAIPQKAETFEQQRAIFHAVQQAQQHLIDTGHPLDTLSLGMSADLEAAIAEGSTMVRIGTAIFGPRKTAP